MKAVSSMTPGELAAYLQTALRKEGVDLVLTGGAAVTVYSAGKYVSRDIDFVDLGFTSFQKIKMAMKKLGFKQTGRHFVSPEIKYLIEFVASPLSVGSEPVSKITEIQMSTGTLKVISPTDCVKDRLADFFYWDDKQALEQALLVARSKKIDLKEVERWARAEKMSDKFKQFLTKYKSKRA